mmetsp:Transcript_21599/g.54396  ORF Transcript_21599/g.54396 Transcript_21599/m.54396 type:complete len:202 (-) Transcript_21599:205-810(-)
MRTFAAAHSPYLVTRHQETPLAPLQATWIPCEERWISGKNELANLQPSRPHHRGNKSTSATKAIFSTTKTISSSTTTKNNNNTTTTRRPISESEWPLSATRTLSCALSCDMLVSSQRPLSTRTSGHTAPRCSCIVSCNSRRRSSSSSLDRWSRNVPHVRQRSPNSQSSECRSSRPRTSDSRPSSLGYSAFVLRLLILEENE